MKKLFAVLLALTLVLSMGTMAFAEGETTTPSGKITISNAIKGEEYKIYKMLDFTPSNTAGTQGVYTIADGWEDFFKTETALKYFEVTKYADKTTVAMKKDVTTVEQELAQAAIEYAAGKEATDSDIAEAATVEFTGLDLGYYAIDTSIGTLCALTNTNSNFTTVEKNGGATIDKKIVEDGDLVDTNNVAIGDTVNYQSKIVAGKGTVNYVVHDKFSEGLTFDDKTVVVKVDYKAEDKDDKTLKVGEDYVLNTTGCADGCTFEIDFTDTFEATLSETDEIIITYSATLNENAVVGEAGNPNEIELTYGKAQETTKDVVITYTTKLTINKVDGNNDALKGAGFTLYKGSGADKTPVGEEIKGEDLTTFVWNGLEAGKYTLEETTVPAGYNKAKDIEFTITWEAPKDAEGNVIEIATGEEKATWTDDSDSISVAGGVFSGTVVNNTGSLLPETGGIGTTIFYIVGITLMLGAGIILISKKRMASFA